MKVPNVDGTMADDPPVRWIIARLMAQLLEFQLRFVYNDVKALKGLDINDKKTALRSIGHAIGRAGKIARQLEEIEPLYDQTEMDLDATG